MDEYEESVRDATGPDDGTEEAVVLLCHMKPMKLQHGDDGCQQVEYFECEVCGHTKEVGRVLAG